MQRMQSSFKITLLLYIIVLILPFSFYFVYSSFQTMQKDTKTVQLVSWTAGAIENLGINPSDQDNKQTIIKVDQTLQNISAWAIQNNNSEFYIGPTRLSEDFSTVQSCWNAYKQKLSEGNADAIRQHSLQCYNLTDNLAIIIEKMVYLKQNKIINIFYLSLTMAMIVMLLLIYLVRIYIHRQMRKHAIHDHVTRLFNKKYFLSELGTACARSIRYKAPLSLVSITIDNLKKYDKKTKKRMLSLFGELVRNTTRESDVACRYDEKHFAVILEDPEEENVLKGKERIEEVLKKYDFKMDPKPRLRFSVSIYDEAESAEEFAKRSLS